MAHVCAGLTHETAHRPIMTRCYLDYNATAPVRPEVTLAVAAALGRTGNPSSVHQAGREARALLEHARAAVAALVGARAGCGGLHERRHRGEQSGIAKC